MKKLFTLPVLFLSLATSSAFAAGGATPRCSSGSLNLVVVNKDVPSCMPLESIGDYGYCLYYASYDHDTREPYKCLDYDKGGELQKNNNVSVSYAKTPPNASITYHVAYYKNGKVNQAPYLRLQYSKGTISDNCSDIFGSDLNCTITQTGSRKHKIYTLTISKNP